VQQKSLVLKFSSQNLQIQNGEIQIKNKRMIFGGLMRLVQVRVLASLQMRMRVCGV